MSIQLTSAIIKSIAPLATDANIANYLQPLNDTLAKYISGDTVVIAMFLAQILHESASFRYVEELASGAEYEGRKDLGNIYAGDGVRYKGRGLIQITGRANYQALSQALGKDFINHPEILEMPENAALSAGWFWVTRNLNTIASPGTEQAFETVTQRINGGLNGLADRQQYWAKAKAVLYPLASQAAEAAPAVAPVVPATPNVQTTTPATPVPDSSFLSKLTSWFN
jgi:putative chitinase